MQTYEHKPSIILVGTALALVLLLGSCGGGGGSFFIVPGSDEARAAQTEIEGHLSSLETDFEAHDAAAAAALTTSDVLLGGNFWYEATGAARLKTRGQSVFEAALNQYFAGQPDYQYTFHLDREPEWDGDSAVCQVTINIKQPATVARAAAFVSHTWTDYLSFTHTDGGWLLSQFCTLSKFHDEGNGVSF